MADQKPLTKAEASKLIKRTVAVVKDGKTTGDTKDVAVKTVEVLSFKEYPDHVVVVTNDGQKLKGDK